MANTKEYYIKINGLTESVSAVESLNKQLDALEKRMKALESSSVKVNTGGGGNASALSQEAAVQKEINKLKAEGERLDAKIVAAQDEVYKRVDATKQLYKETIADQKAMAAQERLTADAYSNTMQGMKNHLADLKAAINVTDLGDSDKIKQMTQEANELTNKLKEMEQAYGQYGRNVGNYAEGVAEGLQKVKVNVGGTVREFANAREASRALSNELKTMAINGQQGTKAFKDMQVAVAKLNSDIKDATVSSRAMDNLLDTMQSLTAIGQVGQGFSALFGFDDDEIQKSIQKLVALQNVMQGIEKLNQQMNSGEGIGGWLSKGNSMIDNFVAKLTGAAKAQESLNAANKAGEVASKGIAAAEEAQAVATNTATVATKGLSLALKALGIGLIISAVATLITYWDDIYDYFTDTIPVLKNLEKWFDKIRAVAVGVGSAILNYMVQPLVTLVKVIKAVIDGNFSDIPKIIGEGMKKTFDVAGNFQKGYNKETERQQKVHNNKMLKEQKKANDEWLADEEAKYGKSYENTKKYLNQQMALVTKQLANTRKGSKEYDALIQEHKEIQRKIWENERTEREKNAKKSAQDSKKYAKEAADAEKELAELKIANMKEGLNKELKQLEFEKNQRLAKVRSNGVKVGELTIEIEKLYANKEKKLREDHAKEVEKIYTDMWEKIHQVETNATLMNLDTELTQYENKLEAGLNKIQDKLNSRYASYPIQYPGNMSKIMADRLGIWEMGSDVKGNKNSVEMAKEYLRLLEDIELAKANAFAEDGGVIDANVDEEALELSKKALEEWLKLKDKTQEEMEDWYLVHELRNKGYTESLANAFRIRIADMKKYFYESEELQKQYEGERIDNEIAALNKEYEIQKSAENKRFGDELRELGKHQQDLIAKGKDYEALVKAENKTHRDALEALTKKRDAEAERLEIEHGNRMREITSNSLNGRIQEYRDFYTAIGNLQGKQPQLMGGVLGDIGIINISKTRKNYKEVLDSFTDLMESLQKEKDSLQLQFDRHEISFDDFQQAKRELNDLEQASADAAQQTQEKLKNLTGEFISSINKNFQIVMQSVQDILSVVWEAEDAAFDKEQDEIDKTTDALKDKLSEQEDILEKHKSAVESIEDELATSHGSRRQNLIDMLNAEIEAQRRAAAEEKKIQKEKEANEKKQDEIERQRKISQFHRDKLQAIVNGAMAVTYAAVNKWPIPAIPLMALAASTTAAQLAIMSANKPYANGGLLEGPSHKHGGIPIPGTGIEVEGKEYVIRKRSTAPNMDVLDYINKSERKLDLGDFIDFYSSKVRKSISTSSPRAKFADGGSLPTLSNIDVNDRLLDAFEDYSNRPIYVAVTDINARQAAVRNVQVLAGLNPE